MVTSLQRMWHIKGEQKQLYGGKTESCYLSEVMINHVDRMYFYWKRKKIATLPVLWLPSICYLMLTEQSIRQMSAEGYCTKKYTNVPLINPQTQRGQVTGKAQGGDVQISLRRRNRIDFMCGLGVGGDGNIRGQVKKVEGRESTEESIRKGGQFRVRQKPGLRKTPRNLQRWPQLRLLPIGEP